MLGSLIASSRPGNNSGFSGILGFGSEIFCENAIVATQETVIVHCEFLESELLTEKTQEKMLFISTNNRDSYPLKQFPQQ